MSPQAAYLVMLFLPIALTIALYPLIVWAACRFRS